MQIKSEGRGREITKKKYANLPGIFRPAGENSRHKNRKCFPSPGDGDAQQRTLDLMKYASKIKHRHVHTEEPVRNNKQQ